jgi:acetyltransferase EpsM
LDDTNAQRHGLEFCGAPVLSTHASGGLASLREAIAPYIFIAIGNCPVRSKLAQAAEAAGLELVTVIHPRAVIAMEATLGRGTFVAAGAVINPGTTLGCNVIVNTCASVDHDCHIGEGVHLAPGSRLAGGVTVGARTWIGLNACVIQGRTIGRDSMIGAGAVVLQDLPDEVVAFGIPARVQRRLEQ